MKYLLSLFLILSISTIINAKDAYKIDVKLINSQDTSLLLVSYYGNTNQIVDTAFLDKGVYTFSGDEALKGGIYLVVFQNKQYFEMVVDKEQHFSMQTDPSDPVNKMKIKNSQDNIDFYAYLKQVGVYGKKDQDLNKEYKAAEGDKEKQDKIKKEITDVNEQVKTIKLDFIKEHQGSLFAKILQASEEPDVPIVLPKKDDGSPDSSYIYRYYKAHYFDGFDFADERLLRTPIYANKIKRYFKTILVQRPDTLIKEANMIIEKAKPNKETYKYCIWYFTYESETSQIMGMDEVFVALGKKYYLTGEAYWVNDATLKRMTKRINTLDRLLIGKKAPNMVMQDTLMNLRSLHDVKANYTIALFWDPDCGHCKHEINEAQPWTKENAEKYGVKVFAVCSDTSVAKWTKKIHEYKIYHWINVDGPRSLTENYHDLYDIISTPTIYLLDKDKNILAKRLNWKQTTDFIKRDYEAKLKEENKK
jgi:thiol-disulfide isomerase/thioredoxin